MPLTAKQRLQECLVTVLGHRPCRPVIVSEEDVLRNFEEAADVARREENEACCKMVEAVIQYNLKNGLSPQHGITPRLQSRLSAPKQAWCEHYSTNDWSEYWRGVSPIGGHPINVQCAVVHRGMVKFCPICGAKRPEAI